MIVNRKATMIANRFRLGWGNRLLVFLRALLSRWMNLGSTEISRLGSLFIYGAERFIRGNDMQATFTFKEDLDLEQIRQSYERMIVENPVLRSKWTGNDKNRRYCWSEFTRNEWEERLAIEKDRAMKIHVPEKVGAEFFSTNERLPVRLTPIGKRKLVLSVNHVFSNGLGCLAWWDKWLTYYARATGHPIGECRAADDELSMVKELSYTKRFLMKGFSVFLAVVYMATLAAKAGRHAGRSTVDLTHGRKSVPNRSGYSTKAYALSRAETEEIVSRSKGKKISVSEYVCIALVESFFDKVPQKRRVLVSAPVDLREMLPEVHALDVGNYTGSLIFQIFRERSIEAQVHSSFKWMRRGVPYGVVKLLSLGMRDEYIIIIFQLRSLEGGGAYY